MKQWLRYPLAAAIAVALCSRAYGQEAKPAAAPEVKPRACVIDMDGTIADESARRAKAEKESPKDKDKKEFYNIYFSPELIAADKPIEKARETLAWVSGQGVDIYYVSSRPQKCLKASMKWIEDNRFPKATWVYHRKGFSGSAEYKAEVIEKIKERADVLFGVGDRDTDIEAYKNSGITPIMVEAGSDKAWEKARTEIEKIIAVGSTSKEKK